MNNGGNRFIITVLICLILLFLALFVFFDGRLGSNGEVINSSNSSSSIDGGSSSGGGEQPGGDHLIGKATLKRVGLKGYRMQGGSMVEFTDDSTVDFSGPTDQNLFGIQPGELIIPGCKYEATMELSNDGDFALGYWMEVIMTSEYDSALAQQLKVTVTINETEYSNSVSVGVPVGDERTPIGSIAEGEKITFTVSVEFVDSEDNNAAQDQTVAFDLYVHTAQES